MPIPSNASGARRKTGLTASSRHERGQPPVTVPSRPAISAVGASPPISIHPIIEDLLRQGAAVAIGVSGGKDSQAAAMATFRHLDRIGHPGPRLLIHADLGSVEWKDSLPACERLTALLGSELVVVRRKQGGLMEQWETRWRSNVLRYENLSTVTLVPCWSTPRMRFCTSAQKTAQIHSELKRRFRGMPIVSVIGIRRDESSRRARAEIADRDKATGIWTWRPILDWSASAVFSEIDASGLEPHPAYRQFGMTRVSCRFCIMSSLADLTAATCQPETHNLYRKMVGLECRSTFAFQGGRWLGDVAPYLLGTEMRDAFAAAKDKAARRKAAEQRLTNGMLYVKGWPTRMLTDGEADLLAEVRSEVGTMLGLRARYLDRDEIHGRYAELLEAHASKRRAA